jgi:ATP-dependent protease HslVU (ClpYQ) peptidase subunit
MVDAHGRGYIACDSLGSDGYTGQQYANPKVFAKGGMLIGYTSSYRMGQLLQYGLTLPEHKPGQNLDEYMHVDFVESVRSLLRDNGYLKIDYNVESGGTFMVITSGRLYVMTRDLALMEGADTFNAVGSGEHYARAVLQTLSNEVLIDISPREALETAISVASKYVVSVGGIIHHLGSK